MSSSTPPLSLGVFISLGSLFSLTFVYACAALLRFRLATRAGSAGGGCCGCGEAPPWTLRNTVHLLIALSTLGAWCARRARDSLRPCHPFPPHPPPLPLGKITFLG